MYNENQDIQKQIDEIQETLRRWKHEPLLKEHNHTGYDLTKVEYVNINRRIIYVSHTVPSSSAATAANYGVFYIAPVPCVLNSFREVHQVAGSDAGTVSIDLEKLTDGVAPDSGAVMLNSALSLKATANTVQTADMIVDDNRPNRTLALGDRLCLKDTGVLTSVSNVSVLVELLVL